MKIERTATDYSGIGEIKTRQFRVEDTVMLANLLSNMYSDPVMAVIREYVCNAVDSHKAAGCPDKPVTVISPSLLEPSFVVKDEGIGMSDDQVMELFSTYGSSSKRQSNDLIGGFGVGSKAGFAYTDNFTVESVYNGQKLTYVVFMCEVNGPSIELLSRISTTEHNGFTVKIPVKKQDINTFRDKITHFLGFADFPWEAPGLDIEPAEYTKEIDLDGWVYEFPTNTYTINDINIKMGPVLYTVKDLYDKWQSPFENNPIIECPIGTFQIAPDRESIIVKPETKTLIKEKLNKLVDVLNDEFNQQIKSEPTWHKAYLKYAVINKESILNSYKFRWRNKKDCYVEFKEKIKTVRVDYNGHGYSDTRSEINITSVKAFIDLEGKKTNHIRIVKNYEKEHPSTQYGYYVILPECPKERLKLWLKLGRPEIPILKYSEWVSRRQTTKASPKKTVEFRVYNYKNKRIKECQVNLTDNQKHVYIPTTGGQVKALGENVAYNEDREDIKNLLVILGVQDTDVILVPQTLRKKIPDSWKNLQPHIENTFRQLSEMNIVKSLFRVEFAAPINCIASSVWLERLNDIYKNFYGIEEIEKLYGFHFPKKVIENPVFFPKLGYKNRIKILFNKENLKAETTYPLIESYNTNSRINSIEYVEAINSFRKIKNPRFKPLSSRK